MPDTLPVHLNRESLHSLDVPNAIETDGSFDVLLRNHGEAVHVHVHLDDALSELATLDATNHYVQADSDRPVRVTINQETNLRGKLKIATGYGATTRYVDVDLVEPNEPDEPVQVDESLSKPQPKKQDTTGNEPFIDRLGSPVLLLASLALVLAIVIAIVVPVPIVQIGAAVVVLAVIAGLLLTYSG